MKIIYSGPSASGKSSQLIEKYLAHRENNRLSSRGYYLVANNQHIKDLEKQLLTAYKEPILFSPAVETINSLAEKISSRKKMSEVRKQLILTDIIKKHNFFSSINDYFDIYESISDMVSEIRNYLIDRSGLSTSSGNPAIIRQIIEEYERELVNKDLYDMERILATAKPLQQYDYLILDGFDSFNELQKSFLTKLFERTENIYIGLTYDKDNKDLFPDSLDLRDYLLKIGFQEEYLNKSYLKSELQDLSTNFLVFNSDKKQLNDSVGRLTADNIQLQYELIARQIIEHYKTGQYKWSDFGIILRQINERRYMIKNIFEKFNIPLTVHEGLYLWRAPLLQWLINLYRFAIEGFVKEDLLEFLNSGFLDLGYKDYHQLKRLFSYYPFSRTYQDIEQDVENKKLLEVMADLQAVCQQLRDAGSIKQQWSVLSSFCQDRGIINRLKADLKDASMEDHARENLKAYSRLKSYFQDLHEEIPAPVDLKQSYSYIDHFMTQNIIRIDKYPSDRVQLYDAPQARQKRFKIVFIADMVFGNYPLPQLNRTLLDDDQRKKIGLRPFLARQAKENTIFYQLLGRASQFIYFCDYAYTLYGSEVTPSTYLDWLEDNYQITAKYYKKKKYSEIFSHINELSEKDYKYALANYLYSNYPDYNEEVRDQDIDKNDLELIKDLIGKRADLRIQREFNELSYRILQKRTSTLSVTSLEQFDRCPFLFYCRYLLGIDSADEFSIYAYRGSVVHKVLELFFQKHNSPDLELGKIDQIMDDLLENQLEELKNRYPEQYYQAEKKVLKEKLVLFIKNQLLELQEQQLKPTKYEYKIEEGQYSFQGITIKGKVDRIDEDEQRYQVVDYKTGMIDITKGRLDQVLLYTYIINETEITAKQPQDPRYLKFPDGQSKSVSWDKENVRQSLTRVLQRIKKGEFYHFDQHCNFNSYKKCAFSAICERINRGNDEDQV